MEPTKGYITPIELLIHTIMVEKIMCLMDSGHSLYANNKFINKSLLFSTLTMFFFNLMANIFLPKRAIISFLESNYLDKVNRLETKLALLELLKGGSTCIDLIWPILTTSCTMVVMLLGQINYVYVQYIL